MSVAVGWAIAGWAIAGWGIAAATANELRLVPHDPGEQAGPADQCVSEACTSLLGLIQGAERTLDLAFYGFREQTALYDAVTEAQARGVRVRLVVDQDLAGSNPYRDTDRWTALVPDTRTDRATDVASAAERGGRFAHLRDRCPRPDGHRGPLQCLAFDLGDDRCLLVAHASVAPITFAGDIMHDKFAVADGQRVWTGSMNASDSCTGGYNANLVVTFDAPVVAAWYTTEFEQMYVGGRFHGDKAPQGPMRAVLSPGVAVEVSFSPQHQPLTRAVIPRLAAARERIDVAVFFLTHTGVTQALLDAHRRGVRVRVLLDATGASNEYSKHEVLRAAGIPVKIEDHGGKMHAKTAIVDGELVVAGSMNWTAAGDRENDENTVIIASRAHAGELQAWFDRLWAAVPDRWAAGRPDAESRDSGASCTDGADNDHDDRVDAEDPGCSASPPALRPPPPMRIVRRGGAPCKWDLVAPAAPTR